MWTLLASLALAQAPAPSDLAPLTVAPPAPPTVTVLYNGGSGGVSAGKYPFEILRELEALDRDTETERARVAGFSGALAQGDWVMWAPDRGVAGALAFLGGQGQTCGAPEPAPARITNSDLLVLDQPAGWLDALGGATTLSRSRCASADGAEAILVGPAQGAPSWRLEDWEFRRGLTGAVRQGGVETGWTAIGRPVQEAARTWAEVRRQQAADPALLFVDAGDLLDGASSVVDGALSLHRPTLLGAAAAARPAALAPGRNELLAGARAFLAEIDGRGLQYVASNWSAPDPALQLPRSLVREVPTAGGPVRVAFVSALDPDLVAQIPALAAEGVVLLDPVTALNAEVDRLRRDPNPPHAIVALSTAGAAIQSEIRRKVRGVDVLLGDPTFATLRVAGDEIRLRPLAPGAKGAAITLPMDGLGRLELAFDPDSRALSAVRWSPVLINAAAPPDPEILARVTRVRASVYPALDRPLLDAPSPTEPLDVETWSRLVCEAVRRHTRADTVLLRALPPPPRAPGPQTEMNVVDALAMLDVLELHEMPGEDMPDLLSRAIGEAPVSCGAQPGAEFPFARGRLLEDGRTYRLVTTDRTRAESGLDDILEAVRSGSPLDQPTWRALRGPEGGPLTLRAATLAELRALRDERGVEGLGAYVTGTLPRALPPLWLLRVDALSLSGARLDGMDDATFASVPETLASAPSSASWSGEADLSLAYGSASAEWDLRARAGWGQLSSGGADPTETADDLIGSSSLALPRLSLPPLGPVRLRPYGELRLDSEWSPTEGNPRQADLSALVGLSAARTLNVRGLHAGLFLNEDLGAGDGRLEPGARLDVSLLFLAGDWMKVLTAADVQGFLPRPDDSAEDLLLRAEGSLKLAFPLAHWLDLGLYGQGLAIRGRVPETDHWGLATTAGVSLDAVAAFELAR